MSRRCSDPRRPRCGRPSTQALRRTASGWATSVSAFPKPISPKTPAFASSRPRWRRRRSWSLSCPA